MGCYQIISASKESACGWTKAYLAKKPVISRMWWLHEWFFMAYLSIDGTDDVVYGYNGDRVVTQGCLVMFLAFVASHK